MYALEGCDGNESERDEAEEAIFEQGDVSYFVGEVGGIFHGDGCCGACHGGRIVHAVADHDDAVPLFAQSADKVGFLLRRAGCVAFGYPQSLGDGSGACLGVAREQNDAIQAELAQFPDDLGGLGAEGVVQANGTGKLAADGQPCDGFSRSYLFRQFRSRGYAFVGKEELSTADEGGLSMVGSSQASGYDEMNVAVLFVTMTDAAAACFAHNSLSHAVVMVFFDAGDDTQDILLRIGGDGQYLADRWCGSGECAGLVEDDGVGHGYGFEVFPAFDHDSALDGLAHGRSHDDGSGELERTTVIDHQDGGSAPDAAGKSPCEPGGK